MAAHAHQSVKGEDDPIEGLIGVGEGAGVGDFDAVAEALLDSYETERAPNVELMTQGAVQLGRIIRREIPADIVFENDELIAFRDISPQAPVHILFVPKRGFATLNDVPATESALLGEMMATATRLAGELGVADSGYRVVMNCNGEGGQSVYHIHLHLLAGRQLGWPPG